ncbi:MAG TPA: penicillin-binding protein 2 [bacterium]|nr:penicillin-binding protein 2 [bacterium]
MRRGKILLTLKSPHVDRRVHLFLFGVMGVFSILVFRLWSIQVYRQEYYKQRFAGNYIRELPIQSKRGMILDRNGRILAEDINYWDVWIPIKGRKERTVTPDVKQSLTLLSQILEIPYATLESRYLKNRRDPNYKHLRVKIAERVPFEKYVALETRLIEFPETAMVFPVAVPMRHYRFGPVAAHILGYTGEISERELANPQFADYRLGSYVGKAGVEKQYEEYLHGKEGILRVQVDTNEIQKGPPIEVEPAVPGNNIVLSIDYDLQVAAEQILGASHGVIIVADPRDNSILAMASSPRYNPNLLRANLGNYILDPGRPMLHRAIAGFYPPGSVFKIFEVLALLEELKLSPMATEYCPGVFRRWGRPWKCHKPSGHGRVNMFDAVRLSCDVYFYNKVGIQLGNSRLHKWATEFGLTTKTDIDLPEEPPARVFPTPASVPRWTQGEMINLSIGQGRMLFTPLQISTGVCAIANRGTVYKPRVAQKVIAPDGKIIKTFDPAVTGVIRASTQSWDVIHRAMWEVVNTPSGTGRRIVDPESNFIMAGKTGTAQIPPHDSHAWFVCYGPFDNPEIVVTVLVEHSGHGGEVASPLAKKIVDVYLGRVKLEELV